MLSISLFALAAAQAASGKPGKPPDLVGPPMLRVPAPMAPPAPPSPPAPPPPPRTIEPARARANLASLFSDDDYPAEALFNEEEGITSFRLEVGANGRVTGCTVTASAGSPSLDEATCRILRSRARFTPARGAGGAPVPDSVRSRVLWRLAGEHDTPLLPPDPATGVALPRPPQRARPARPLASLVHPDDYPGPRLSPPAGGTTHFRLEIGPDGRATGCSVGASSGSAALDSATCRIMRARARFTPARDRAGNPVADAYRGHVRWPGHALPVLAPTPAPSRRSN